MKNRLTSLFEQKPKDILNIYFTAGYPKLESTEEIILSLVEHGVDLIEIGIPYSDPMADGTTIQESSAQALKNGITLDILFAQIKSVRPKVDIPFVAMGYLNQMMQYGVEQFLKACNDSGIDGLIIPDLPLYIYENEFKELFLKYNISINFLITPQTSASRISQADDLSNGFIYMVSQSSITGKTADISKAQVDYFNRIDDMKLRNPKLIGFGIHNQETKNQAYAHAQGAIIGSAFIRAIGQENADLSTNIAQFMKQINGQ